MMNASQIQIVVFDGSPVDPRLRKWVESQPHFAYASHIAPKGFPDLVAMQRNRICRWFLDHTDRDCLLMLDADQIPVEATVPILTAEAPIAGCAYVQRDARIGHEPDGEAAAGCLRISRAALQAIDPPWFQWVLSDDGCEVAECDCGHFCRKAREAGYHPVTVGRIGHIVPAVVILNDDNDTFNIKLLSLYGESPL